jgi:hypothetical protein
VVRLLDERPVANGLRTDHPIPDLPFVDDSHIPIEDPARIEAVGRNRGNGMWGRKDPCRGGSDAGWVAFTTDPERHDLAWCVRWHPVHGRSVVLYRNEDAPIIHTVWEFTPALLFRSGGYWWDGTNWYRPAQVWDAASELYFRRPVPSATTIAAADLAGGDPARARVLEVPEIDTTAPPSGNWADDLALWAAQHAGLDLQACVVRVSAPELAGDQLVDTAGLAEIGGVAASTLRAYISRGEKEVPQPQAAVGGRSMWARPVAEEWAEARRRSPEGVEAAVSADRDGTKLAPGVAETWDRFSRIFFSALWENPDRRRRWALRWRNQAAVRDVAEGLAWYAAAELGGHGILPAEDLAVTIRHAWLDEFAAGQALRRSIDGSDPDDYGIVPAVAEMLDWLIRYHPATAAVTIGEIIGEAERRLGIPREVSEWSLRTALCLDGKLDDAARDEFLDRALSPTGPGKS